MTNEFRESLQKIVNKKLQKIEVSHNTNYVFYFGSNLVIEINGENMSSEIRKNDRKIGDSSVLTFPYSDDILVDASGIYTG